VFQTFDLKLDISNGIFRLPFTLLFKQRIATVFGWDITYNYKSTLHAVFRLPFTLLFKQRIATVFGWDITYNYKSTLHAVFRCGLRWLFTHRFDPCNKVDIDCAIACNPITEHRRNTRTCSFSRQPGLR
jgi:hypothetical protein